MNRITDLIASTQLCTLVAALFTYWAHLIESGSILNPNWNFMVYVLLAFACFLMMFPHLIKEPTWPTTTTQR